MDDKLNRPSSSLSLFFLLHSKSKRHICYNIGYEKRILIVGVRNNTFDSLFILSIGRGVRNPMYEDIPIILDDYLNYAKTVKGLSPNTIKEYYYDLKFFIKYMRKRKNLKYRKEEIEEIDILDVDERDLEKVSLPDMHAYLAYSDSSKGDSATTRARKTSSLRSFYKYLTSVMEYFEKNPAEKLTTPKVKKRHPVYLTLEEAIRLIEVAADQDNKFFKYRDIAILVTFLTTGIRLSELTGLDVGSIRDGKFNVIGKGDKERTVYMTESCQEAIHQYLQVRPIVQDENALFLSSRKQRMSTRAVQHRIDHFLEKAGFDTSVYSTHKLRHTAATLMYKEGVDIRTLQRILGHASLATTQIYTHVEDDLAKKAVDKNPLANLNLEDINEDK